MNGIDFEKLPPILRALLASDGTVTKLLEAFYAEPIEVQRLSHAEFPAEHDLPPLDIVRGDTLLHRRILMCGARSATVYGFAQSYLRTDLLWPGVRDDLVRGTLGIGELMRARRIETYREPLTCEFCPAAELAPDLRVAPHDLLVSRTYRIFVGRAPCIYIVDKFPFALYSGHASSG